MVPWEIIHKKTGKTLMMTQIFLVDKSGSLENENFKSKIRVLNFLLRIQERNFNACKHE